MTTSRASSAATPVALSRGPGLSAVLAVALTTALALVGAPAAHGRTAVSSPASEPAAVVVVPTDSPTTSDSPGTVGEIVVEPVVLPTEEAVVTVSGTGFDTAAGIYVAVCVDNGPGSKPGPCIGGADTTGTGGASWISDNPPSYAAGLTQPYGPDGSFRLSLPVPMVDDVTGTDCREVRCAVTTRYDHTRGEDRGADNVVAVSFAAADAAGAAEAPPVPADDDAEDAASSDSETVPDGNASADADGSGVSSTVVISSLVAVVVVAGLVGSLLIRRRVAASGDASAAPSTGDTP